MQWLAINFYQLPLDVFFLSNEPKVKLKEKTFAFSVVENGLLTFCNNVAIDKGLESGMKVSTAYALYPELKIKLRSIQAEKNVLTRLATIAYGFSSQVTILNEYCILLEVGASCKLFSDLNSLLERLNEALLSFNVNFYLALSITPKAAFLKSCYYQKSISRLLGKSRCDGAVGKKKMIEIEKNEIKAISVDFLSREKLLKINGKVGKMKQMGLFHISDLIDLPLASIGRRFGKDFIVYLDCLLGKTNDPQSLFSLPERFLSRRYFLDGLDSIEQIVFPAKPIVDEFCHFLKLRQVLATKILWRFVCFNGDELFFEIPLSSASQNVHQLMMLTRLKIQNFKLKEKIETIELSSKEFIGVNEKQAQTEFPCFYSDSIPACASVETIENYNILNEKISVRLLSEQYLKLVLSNDYLPEKASTIHNANSNYKNNSDVGESSVERSLWLFSKPETVNFNGANVTLNYHGELTIISKRERIENEWWLGEKKRDYYIAQHISGVRYWIYYDLLLNQWFVHGIF